MSKKQPRIGRPPKYRDKLAKMRRKAEIYFPGASIDSVKAIASHLGAELGRKYTTRREDGGVICWRET